jgi:hypothetical protein
MTAQTEFQAFLDAQAEVGYVLGDITGTADGDMLRYTELKIAVSQEASKIKAFNEAKAIAFQELSLQHNDEMVALGQLWQTKEDNDYEL